MFVTGLCFVAVTAIVKYVGTDLPAAESAFLRYVLGLVFLLPVLGQLRALHLTPRQIKLFCGRGVAHTIAVTLWFYSMSQITMAEVTALNYLSPVYVTLGAIVLFGERLAFRRILAVIAALVGAMIILRPGFRELSPGHIAMLAAAFFMATSYLLAKLMSGEVSAGIVVAMLSITVTIGLAPLAYAVWVPPTLEQVGWMALVAGFATAGHYSMTRAFAAAPVTVTQPVTFLQLIWSVALGWLLFDEALDIWVMLGGLLILASVTFIAWREAMLKRREITPNVHAPKG